MGERRSTSRRKRRPRLERRNGYRVLVGGPVPPQAAAITLGNTICVRHEHAHSDALMSHELVHVRQFQELGWPRFLVRYVRSYLRGRLSGYGHMAAYRRIPLEVEASWLCRLHPLCDLEPGGPADTDDVVTRARGPRLAATQRLHDHAEAQGWLPPTRRRREASSASAEVATTRD